MESGCFLRGALRPQKPLGSLGTGEESDREREPGPTSSLFTGLCTRSSPDSADIGMAHTPSIAFRHLPPNSAARFSRYATEGARFISAHLSSDAVSALRKVRALI